MEVMDYVMGMGMRVGMGMGMVGAASGARVPRAPGRGCGGRVGEHGTSRLRALADGDSGRERRPPADGARGGLSQVVPLRASVRRWHWRWLRPPESGLDWAALGFRPPVGDSPGGWWPLAADASACPASLATRPLMARLVPVPNR